jgi:hypothetical protein
VKTGGMYTAREFADKMGLSLPHAYHILMEKVRSGEIVRGKVRQNGRIITVYYLEDK